MRTAGNGLAGHPLDAIAGDTFKVYRAGRAHSLSCIFPVLTGRPMWSPRNTAAKRRLYRRPGASRSAHAGSFGAVVLSVAAAA
jgi:hypothetical protein